LWAAKGDSSILERKKGRKKESENHRNYDWSAYSVLYNGNVIKSKPGRYSSTFDLASTRKSDASSSTSLRELASHSFSTHPANWQQERPAHVNVTIIIVEAATYESLIH